MMAKLHLISKVQALNQTSAIYLARTVVLSRVQQIPGRLFADAEVADDGSKK